MIQEDVKHQIMEACAVFLAETCASSDAGARKFAKFMFTTGFVGQLIDELPQLSSNKSPFVNAMVIYLTEMLKQNKYEAAIRPGVPAAVLALCHEHSSLGEAAAQALESVVLDERSGTLSMMATPKDLDLEASVTAVGWARKHEKIADITLERRLALRYLTAWTVGGGSAMAHILARKHNLGPTLAETAAAPFDSTARECAALMLALACHTPHHDLPFLRMDMWLYPLACFCADAGIDGDNETVKISLRAMEACLKKGVPVPEGLYRHALAPLLKHTYSIDAWGKADVAAVIAALAPSGVIPLDQRLSWVERLMADAMNESSSDSNREMVSAISALCTSDMDGLHVLHSWLASLIVTLSLASTEKATATRQDKTPKEAHEESIAQQMEEGDGEFKGGRINPAYARGIASDILQISDRLGHYTEPPASAEEWLSPAAIATYPAISAVVDEELADAAVRRGLEVLSMFVSIDKEHMPRFIRAGGLHLLHRLLEHSPRSISRIVANLLATLSIDPLGAAAIKNFSPFDRKEEQVHFDWISWCNEVLSTSTSPLSSYEDCETLSSAAKVLINVRLPTGGYRLHQGVHLFDPRQPHHAALLLDNNQNSVAMDVVFVHGIRGGAFETWRRGRSLESMDTSNCWPAAWLAPALGPRVRLLTIEYSAPASAWDKSSGNTLDGPLEATAKELSTKLIAAGVGARPVVFITHSMGGLVVKEMLARSWLPPFSAVGLVFYSVPHAGSRLADLGWSLRFVGASPAKAVGNLTTGQANLETLNRTIAGMSRRGLSVLSLSEGLPMRLSPPRMFHINAHVVPHESAYPGYGDFAVLDHHDHVTVCKPSSMDDPAYSLVYGFIRKRLDELELDKATRQGEETLEQLAVLP